MRQRAIMTALAMTASLAFTQGCSSIAGSANTSEQVSKSKPNVLWIYMEDIDPVFSPYNDKFNSADDTPTIQMLADQGVTFSSAFSPAPVCSPARSAVITGTMPTTLGVHNHHSSRTIEDAIFLPDHVKTIPELMQTAGYATFNHGKDDYNFIYNRDELYEDDLMIDFWYTFAGQGDWLSIAKQDKPFFGQIQTTGGKWSIDSLYPKIKNQVKTIDRDSIDIPPYYPDIPSIREKMARQYDAARYTDHEVKEILAQLKDNGLLNNTYVFFFSDHGFNTERHKQFVYDGGIHVPLIVAYFGEDGELTQGSTRDDLVNLIDLGPTTLALAGLPTPNYMEGKDVFANDFSRDQVIATRDRCDFTIDRIRAVRTEQFKYIKNYFPERSMMQDSYRDRRQTFKDIKRLYAEGKLNSAQSVLPAPTKAPEELYDVVKDPYEINNLASDPAYAATLADMQTRLSTWQAQTGDKGSEPQNPESLRFMIDRWGERCVNPEYDFVRKHRRHNQPQKSLK
ncbi:sulfatase family protein [Echinimonas agarilytica]|uniref:Sulfatase n=1 Tax=Echinimonas agarilytica TaxID=1215918 RepID=A0AA41W6S6_9GAMM|nr:sulfatase [Echinimonas agarilytica]MCM2680130.1 sulfatase [Echinimonas agarilytica]